VLGEDCLIDTRAYIGDRCTLGDRVILKPQAVIGSDGFGWAFLEGALRKIPQIGTVQLGNDVEIGANSCVDRAQTGVTFIGEGTKIDNLVQIGHNCRIGKHYRCTLRTGGFDDRWRLRPDRWSSRDCRPPHDWLARSNRGALRGVGQHRIGRDCQRFSRASTPRNAQSAGLFAPPSGALPSPRSDREADSNDVMFDSVSRRRFYPDKQTHNHLL
jgi:hypothetical protein